eukprot:1597356-Ditylum_brightwellii.AAC.1
MITLTQTGSIDRIVNALGLDNTKVAQTPAEVAVLGKDPDADRGNAVFNYLSIICIMLYFSSHSCPDIQFVALQCARFSNNPKASHE